MGRVPKSGGAGFTAVTCLESPGSGLGVLSHNHATLFAVMTKCGLAIESQTATRRAFLIRLEEEIEPQGTQRPLRLITTDSAGHGHAPVRGQ